MKKLKRYTKQRGKTNKRIQYQQTSSTADILDNYIEQKMEIQQNNYYLMGMEETDRYWREEIAHEIEQIFKGLEF